MIYIKAIDFDETRRFRFFSVIIWLIKVLLFPNSTFIWFLGIDRTGIRYNKENEE